MSPGFALLVVMIVLLALSLMFGALLQSSRQVAETASGRIDTLKRTAALDGALVTTAYALSLTQQQITLGTPETIVIGNIPVSVTVRPELAKLDVNYAPAESIQKLLEAGELPPDRAKTLSDAIVIWRENGRVVGEGVEAPPIRPFETVADLALVPGGGPDLISCLGTDVTVYARSAGTDTSFASARLRRALTGESQTEARPASYDSVVGGEAGRPDLYEVTEEIFDGNHHILARRQSVIRVTGDNRRPVWVVDQQSSGASDADTAEACKRLARHGR